MTPDTARRLLEEALGEKLIFPAYSIQCHPFHREGNEYFNWAKINAFTSEETINSIILHKTTHTVELCKKTENTELASTRYLYLLDEHLLLSEKSMRLQQIGENAFQHIICYNENESNILDIEHIFTKNSEHTIRTANQTHTRSLNTRANLDELHQFFTEEGLNLFVNHLFELENGNLSSHGYYTNEKIRLTHTQPSGQCALHIRGFKHENVIPRIRLNTKEILSWERHIQNHDGANYTILLPEEIQNTLLNGINAARLPLSFIYRNTNNEKEIFSRDIMPNPAEKIANAMIVSMLYEVVPEEWDEYHRLEHGTITFTKNNTNGIEMNVTYEWEEHEREDEDY